MSSAEQVLCDWSQCEACERALPHPLGILRDCPKLEAGQEGRSPL